MIQNSHGGQPVVLAKFHIIYNYIEMIYFIYNNLKL